MTVSQALQTLLSWAVGAAVMLVLVLAGTTGYMAVLHVPARQFATLLGSFTLASLLGGLAMTLAGKVAAQLRVWLGLTAVAPAATK